jgi:hypothetical protein
MASLCNLAIGILRAHGDRNITAARRRNARDTTQVLPRWHHTPVNQTVRHFVEALMGEIPSLFRSRLEV